MSYEDLCETIKMDEKKKDKEQKYHLSVILNGKKDMKIVGKSLSGSDFGGLCPVEKYLPDSEDNFAQP